MSADPQPIEVSSCVHEPMHPTVHEARFFVRIDDRVSRDEALNKPDISLRGPIFDLEKCIVDSVDLVTGLADRLEELLIVRAFGILEKVALHERRA